MQVKLVHIPWFGGSMLYVAFHCADDGSWWTKNSYGEILTQRFGFCTITTEGRPIVWWAFLGKFACAFGKWSSEA